MYGRTRYNQVTDAGKAIEGFRMGTHRRAEPCNFRDPAGNQSRFRIVAVAKTIRRSGCQCDDIFQSSAKFNSRDVRACVNAEDRAHEHILHIQCALAVMRADNDRGRQAAADLLCMARSGENNDIRSRHFLLDDLRHRHQGIGFHAFCHIDDELAVRNIRRILFTCGSHVRGCFCHHKDVLSGKGAAHIAGELHFIRQFYARKLRQMLSVFL